MQRNKWSVKPSVKPGNWETWGMAGEPIETCLTSILVLPAVVNMLSGVSEKPILPHLIFLKTATASYIRVQYKCSEGDMVVPWLGLSPHGKKVLGSNQTQAFLSGVCHACMGSHGVLWLPPSFLV